MEQATPSAPAERYRTQVYGLVAYYMALLVVILALVFDLWISGNALLRRLGVGQNVLTAPLFLPLVSAVLGGALGSILYNIRQLFHYYAREPQKYNPRWLGKYVSGPLEGGLLALVVYALLRGGVVVLNPVAIAAIQTTPNIEQALAQADVTAGLAAFGLGTLVGFGTRDVVGWLQDLVETMFGERARRQEQEEPRGGEADFPFEQG